MALALRIDLLCHVPHGRYRAAIGLVRGGDAPGVTQEIGTQTYGCVTRHLASTAPHGYGGNR